MRAELWSNYLKLFDFKSVLIFPSLTIKVWSSSSWDLHSVVWSRECVIAGVCLLQMKKELGDNDSISQEVVGNAHIENYALKMFLYADNEDRAGRFHK